MATSFFGGAFFGGEFFNTPSGGGGEGGGAVYPPIKRGRTLDEAIQAIRDDDDLLAYIAAFMRTVTQ